MRTYLAATALLLISCDGDIDVDPGGDTDPGAQLVLDRVDKGDELSPGDCPEGSEILLAEDLGAGTVEIVHACVWMNLCTDLGASLAYAHPMVELTEHETGEPCFGEGYFSPIYRVEGFEPGDYELELGGFGVTLSVE